MSIRGSQLRIIQQAKQGKHSLSASALALLDALFAYADNEGKCFPSHGTLCADLRCSRDSIIRWSKILVDAGWISVQHTGRSNKYQLLFEKIELAVVQHQMSDIATSDVGYSDIAYKEVTKPSNKTNQHAASGTAARDEEAISAVALTPSRSETGMGIEDQQLVLRAAVEAWGWLRSKQLLLGALADGVKCVGDPDIAIRAIRRVRATPQSGDPVGEVIARARKMARVS